MIKNYLNYIIIINIFISICLIIYRMLKGATVFDRFLAANSLNTKINLLLTFLAIYLFNESFIDIAFIYVLTAFIANYAILKFIRDKNMGGR